MILFVPLMALEQLNDQFSLLEFPTDSSVVTGEVRNSLLSNPAVLWPALTLTGLFALWINMATSMQIKYTSPLTHNISGTAKACTQTVLATYVYHEVKTVNWWLGNFLVLICSASYAGVRQWEAMSRESKSKKNGDEKVEVIN